MKSSSPTSLALAFVFALSLASAFLMPVLAEEGEDHACKHACQPGKFEMSHATGVLYCVNCALKSETGANIDCAKSGHLMALKVSKVVDYCGEEKPARAASTLFFLNNEASKPLLTASPGTQYIVSGRLFESVPMMEVEEIGLVAEEAPVKNN